MNYRVSPFGALDQISRELNHFFEDRPLVAHQLESTAWRPHVDVAESEEAFVVTADIPGVDPENIEINLHNGVLSIRGERTADEESSENNVTRRERFTGSFLRQFNLPDAVDEDGISATSNHGVLEVTIPRAKKAQPRVIKIN